MNVSERRERTTGCLHSIWLVATYSWYETSPQRQAIKKLRRYPFRLKKAYVRISKTTTKPRVQHRILGAE